MGVFLLLLHEQKIFIMIQSNELRIGNLLQDKVSKTELKVIELTEKNIVTYVIDRSMFPLKDGWGIEPIQLTEEWLLNFGFERQPWGLVKGGLLFKDNIKHPCEELTLEIGNGFRVTAQYVHQLQNIYFALTGEEL